MSSAPGGGGARLNGKEQLNINSSMKIGDFVVKYLFP